LANGVALYNVELVRALSEHIAKEEDPKKAHQLLELLHAVIQDDKEEIQLRMDFLKQKYSFVLTKSANVK
jgi:hypothetical protein